MNFLGLGPGELFLIMILALIVFGPGRLPEIGSSLGRAISEFRRASSQLTEELNRELRPETPAQQPARTEDPVILEPTRAAPHEVTIAEEPPRAEEAVQAGAPATSAPVLPDDVAVIHQLEAELEMKKTMNALEIRRLEVELEAKRMEAELAAKKAAAARAQAAAEPAVTEVPPQASAPEPVAEDAAGAPEPVVEVKAAEPEAQVVVAEPAAESTPQIERSNSKGRRKSREQPPGAVPAAANE